MVHHLAVERVQDLINLIRSTKRGSAPSLIKRAGNAFGLKTKYWSDQKYNAFTRQM
jgi:hypothetical protein